MEKIEVRNLFGRLPVSLKEEYFEDLIAPTHFKLERIVSAGHCSPKDFWYDQERNEFVLLIAGSAVLLFENDERIELHQGDYLIIPAHKKHRVEKTDPAQKTYWLALHY